MYETFFGLREQPFELTPNPRYLLLTPRHSEALSTLRYAISARKGVVLLTGPAGTGKTTLVRAALTALDAAPGVCLHLTNPRLSREEFLDFLAVSFQLPPELAASKSLLLTELGRQLAERLAADRRVVIVVDEAQVLSDELLEEVRLLANIETDDSKLITVMLVGQPELAARLDSPAFEPLKQRIALRCSLGPLTLAETAAYIAGRLQQAGGDAARTFTRDAVQMIYEASGGVPRVINVLCDNALVSGFAIGERPVSRALVAEACRDLAVGPNGNGRAARTPRDAAPAADVPAKAPAPRPDVALGKHREMFTPVAPPRRFLFF